MKLKISVLAVFCAVASAFAQSYKISYEKTIKFDEDKIAHLPNEIKERLKSAKKYYSLRIEKDKSIFRGEDGVPDNAVSNQGNQTLTRTFFVKKDQYDLYKDLKNNNFYIETELGNEEYNVAGKLPTIEWKITNETDTILGYKVKKAVGKHEDKDVSIWYSEEIPVKDGPFFYRNLKGLVLKVEADKELYIATKVENGTKEKINIPTNKNAISFEEYNKKKKEYTQKLLNSQGTTTNGNQTTTIKTIQL